MQGLLHVGKLVASRIGLGEWWEGQDGIGAVLKEKLTDMGVPEKGVPINGPKGMSPRQLAEHSGFLKRRRLKRA
jgi:hypothetical protein